MAAFCFALAYGFWLAYRNRGHNRVTQFLYEYVETTPRIYSVNDTLLALVVIMVAVGIGTVVMIVVSA